MNSRKLHFIITFVIISFAVLVRIAFFLESYTDADLYHPQHDAEIKQFWAKAMVTGDYTIPAGEPNPFELWPQPTYPGYPWFMAAHYLLFGIRPVPILVTQFIMGLGTIFLFFFLSYRLLFSTY